MFDFQHLEIYRKAKAFHLSCKQLIAAYRFDTYTKNQLGRASLSVPLNIAEGAGKFSKPDRRNYYITARASVYECVAIMDILHDEGLVGDDVFKQKLVMADELSRILYAMITNLSK